MEVLENPGMQPNARICVVFDTKSVEDVLHLRSHYFFSVLCHVLFVNLRNIG